MKEGESGGKEAARTTGKERERKGRREQGEIKREGGRWKEREGRVVRNLLGGGWGSDGGGGKEVWEGWFDW